MSKAAEIERLIEAVVGVNAELDEQYDRLSIRTDDRVQSRIDKNSAPKFMVERYANQMGEYAFPPVIVTRDGFTVDGNTRNKAREARNERYCSALIIPIDFETADEATKQKLLLLSELVNNMNGLPLFDEERSKMVINMVAMGSSDQEISTKVGVSIKDVRELRDQHKAAQRLKGLGVDPKEFSPRTLRAFGKQKVHSLDDSSYQGVAQLTRDAGMKANEIKALAASLAESGSDEMKRERLARERQAREPQITALQQGQTIGMFSRRLYSSLQHLLQHPIEAFIERNPEKVEDYIEALEAAQVRLREVVALQSSGKPIMPHPLGAGAEEIRPSA
jgi:hypothetical protein